MCPAKLGLDNWVAEIGTYPPVSTQKILTPDGIAICFIYKAHYLVTRKNMINISWRLANKFASIRAILMSPI